MRTFYTPRMAQRFSSSSGPSQRQLRAGELLRHALAEIFQREDLSRAIDNFVIEGDHQIPDPKSIFDFKPDSMSAAEFEELANEVLEKIGLRS